VAQQGFIGGGMWKMIFQFGAAYFMMNTFSEKSAKKQLENGVEGVDGVIMTAHGPVSVDELDLSGMSEQQAARGKPLPEAARGMRNVYGLSEECMLYVHYGLSQEAPPLEALLDEKLSAEKGFNLLWTEKVWYKSDATMVQKNITVGPLLAEALAGASVPWLHAAVIPMSLLSSVTLNPMQVLRQTLPLTVKMRELDGNAGAASLFGDDADTPAEATAKRKTSAKVNYWKTRVDIRPVYDHSVHTASSLKQGPFRRLKTYPESGVYAPYLYVSDFWLLEKDFVPLNDTLADSLLNLTLTYETVSLWKWSIQAQMVDQWSNQGEWGITDTQRDSFMLKRLVIDTNPYLLAFSAAFIGLHTVFSMLAFKNDIQFWRNNESMRGLSARSMVISFVCQIVTALYLLDSQETSRLLLFEILLEAFLATWKLKKAIKIEVKKSFPFVSFGGQKGYEEGSITSKYDEQAMRYMGALLTPLFVGYVIRSALYGKHRGWYSFLVGAAAGGVYTFGFVMMTPQLYINYKLKSVEHLPWRALTYKAMNTFVDDIAALLIDMPLMHRISCFRDDIIFFIYIYQRWAYSIDKSRPSIWAEAEAALRPDPAIAASDALRDAERRLGELRAAEEASDPVAHDAALKADYAARAAAKPEDVADKGDEAAAEKAEGASADDGLRQRR